MIRGQFDLVNQNEFRFVGVDGCPYGWFAVGFRQDGTCGWDAFRTFEELLATYANAELILVDMPIGLPNGPEERRCDKQARALLNQTRANLGPRVFRTPTRTAVEYLALNPHYGDVVEAVQHELAQVVQNELGRAVQPNISQDVENEVIKAVRYAITKGIQEEITDVSLSLQTLEIILKIAQVDNLLPRNEPPYIREVHPEICFLALNGGNAIVPSKDTSDGRTDRIAVLERVGVPAREIYNGALAAFRRNQVSRDDILDALVAAVTAYRGWPDQFQTLPGLPRPGDENLPIQDPNRPLPMEMVYWIPRN